MLLWLSYFADHPWIRDYEQVNIPLDMLIYKHVKSYICSSTPLRKPTLKAFAKTCPMSQISYLRNQFMLLGLNKSGYVSMHNFKQALLKNATDATKDSRVFDFVISVSSLQHKKLDFEEFAAAATSIHQMEGLDSWEEYARRAFELFDKESNRLIMIEELVSELGLSPSIPVHVVLRDWIRHSDGKLSFLRFIKLLHGMSSYKKTELNKVQ
ncbi:hypothetical protein ZOSMA_15G00100 [Zostera marina]|uniref:EF-hand domain-containing protein n=1 Tax=Zostera marina TaxID=29655 RepID=A0A0K9PUR7_ZOSMR|nr:hypothetical protein ZOSMA_15G00100 [Zostera marina]